MRRVASPTAETLTSLKFASFMKVVGRTAVAFTVTVLTPVVGSTDDLKKFGSLVGSVDDEVPR